MLHEKLTALKESSGMTTRQIAEKSGVPVSTVTRILSGETVSPSYDVVQSLVVAMGGSMDEIAGLSSHPAPAPTPAPAFQLPDFQQLLVPFYERALAEKNKWIMILFCCLALVVVFVMVVLMYDITHPNMGYIQY